MFSFYKYHGLGNDFIIIDNRKGNIELSFNTIIKLCDRNFGIGADGIVLLENSSIADLKMIIYNSDGSNPDMCGNATRCFGKFAYDKAICRKHEMSVETAAGVMKIDINTKDDKVETVSVNMGNPIFDYDKIPTIIQKTPVAEHQIDVKGESLHITSLLMGVPHTVVFTDNISDEYVKETGKAIESLKEFPQKTNVNFVKVVNRDEILIRTWERGAGYTYACGTGACACVVAGIINNKLDDVVLVHLRGGDLKIHWKARKDVFMEGPAEELFMGNYLG